MKYAWEELLNKFSITYSNPNYYEQAFTHPSFSNEKSQVTCIFFAKLDFLH